MSAIPFFVELPENPASMQMNGCYTHEATRMPALPSSGGIAAAFSPESEPAPARARRMAARSRMGPRSVPLFYTALLQPPDRLLWNDLPGNPLCRVTLQQEKGEGGCVTLMNAAASPDGAYVWSLPDLALQPGVRYLWRVEPIPGDYAAGEPEGGCRRLADGRDRTVHVARFRRLL